MNREVKDLGGMDCEEIGEVILKQVPGGGPSRNRNETSPEYCSHPNKNKISPGQYYCPDCHSILCIKGSITAE